MKTFLDQFDFLSAQGKGRWVDAATKAAFIARVNTLLMLLLSMNSLAFSQQVNVTGRITDPTGEGIPGVNVIVKGTANGTATDLHGRYAVGIEPGSSGVLAISFVGFKAEEIVVGQQTVIDVQLTPDITELDEIVVTGYSAMRKKDISSSIAVVDVEDMTKLAAFNFAEQLQGKVAGVQISTSGDPGSVQYVRVRGIGTINNNEPFYVIDGVPVQNEIDMNFLNPNDIETMQVLKDAAAASIYGARAANGVIVITTRKGKGSPKINFEFFTGVQNPQNPPASASPMENLKIDSARYAYAGVPFNSQLYIEATPGSWTLPDFLVNNRGFKQGDEEVNPSKYILNTSDPELYDDNYPIAQANKSGTNWFEELFRPATMTSAQFSASSGNENGSHYFSMNYFDQNGTLIRNYFKRIQTRLNNTFQIGRNFRVGENLNVAFQKGTGFDNFGPGVRGALGSNPLVPVHDINGYWATASINENTVASQNRYADGLNYRNQRFTGSVFAEIDFLKHFTFKTNVGVDLDRTMNDYYDYTCPECATGGQTNFLQKYRGDRRSLVGSSMLDFNLSSGNHVLYALAGAEAREIFIENLSASGTGLRFGDDPNYRELSNIQSGTSFVSSDRRNSRMVSLFVNTNYTLNEKYILAATLRCDGSSRFMNDKYGVFPGFSAAWRVSQETFLIDSRVLTDFKLRASWGITGNNEVVGGDYPGYSSYGTSLQFSSYPINGTFNSVSQGFAQVSSGNPDLKWETSTLTNLAFDITIKNSLDLTMEWYSRKTEDMIFGVPQPLETGNLRPINQNVGSMLNKGIDLQLNYRWEALSKKLSSTISITGSHYTNKVLSLYDSASVIWSVAPNGSSPIAKTQAGYPVSQFYGYVAEGLWQSQEQIETILFADPGAARPGRMKFRDSNADGMLNDKDKTFIGNPIPKFILGFNVSLAYKNFDLTIYADGVFGNKVYNLVKGSTDFKIPGTGLEPLNPNKRMLYEAGKTLPVLDLNDNYSGRISSYCVEDGSFFRLRNVSLGYTLPGKTLSKAGLSKARIYLQSQNLFYWTKYSGMDPDVTILNKFDGNQPGRDMTNGLDIGRYPWSRQFIVGINLDF